MRSYGLIFLFVIGWLKACSIISMRPSWVDGVSQRYPDQVYLSASGSADREEDAKNRAFANLAKIFEVQIDDTSIDRNYVSVEQNNSDGAILNTQTSVRYVDAYTSKQLTGAEVAELWRDEKSGRYYALAVIARERMATRLKYDISKANSLVNEYMLLAQQQVQDPVTTANKVFMAVHALQDREKFWRDLLIVDPDDKPSAYLWADDAVQSALSLALKAIIVEVNVSSDNIGYLKPMLQSAAANAGLTVADVGQRYSLMGNLEVEEIGKQQGWYWYRGVLEIKLFDMQNETVRVQERWPIKISGASQEQAKLRLNSSILSLLNQQLRMAIINLN